MADNNPPQKKMLLDMVQREKKKFLNNNDKDPSTNKNKEKISDENQLNVLGYSKNLVPSTSKKPSKVKLSVCKSLKISVKPSNKVIATVLSKLPGSAYDIKENQWLFENQHYEILAAELKKNSIEFDQIPKGTLSLLRKHIPENNFNLSGNIFDSLLLFQRDAVNFALNRNGRILLADDMGLGKTIQALAIAYFYKLEFPLLIISPASLLHNWADSIKRFMDEDSTIIRERSDFGSKISIISYNLTINFIDTIKSCNYGVIICDECHYLKSMTSKRTKNLLPILQKASRLIMISGTPATSRPLELYPILSALDKTLYPSFPLYGNRYCNGRKIGQFYDYRGCSNAEELSVVLERSLMIRRLKDLVLSELPKKFRRQVILEIPGLKISKKGKFDISKSTELSGDNMPENTLLSEFVNAASIKKESVLKYLDNILEKNIKAVVFAHHQEMLDAIEDNCKSKGCCYIRIDGSTQSSRRHALIEDFQNNESVRMAVLSLTACSTGLTLTSAKAVIFAELYWNPGTLLQAEDRIHRLGQVDNVDVHYLVAKATVDEIVWPHILKKLTVLESLGIGKNELKSIKGISEKEKIQPRLDQYFKSKD